MVSKEFPRSNIKVVLGKRGTRGHKLVPVGDPAENAQTWRPSPFQIKVTAGVAGVLIGAAVLAVSIVSSNETSHPGPPLAPPVSPPAPPSAPLPISPPLSPPPYAPGCTNDIDVYLIIDKSGSADDLWSWMIEEYTFAWVDLMQSLPNTRYKIVAFGSQTIQLWPLDGRLGFERANESFDVKRHLNHSFWQASLGTSTSRPMAAVFDSKTSFETYPTSNHSLKRLVKFYDQSPGSGWTSVDRLVDLVRDTGSRGKGYNPLSRGPRAEQRWTQHVHMGYKWDIQLYIWRTWRSILNRVPFRLWKLCVPAVRVVQCERGRPAHKHVVGRLFVPFSTS